jgi:DNA-binding beta-propeller fold protein YncE
VDTSFGTNGFIGSTNGTTGTNAGQFNAPYDVAVSPDGGTISVSDSGNNQIQQFDTNGVFTGSFASSGTNLGQFSVPKGLTYDSGGTLYIVDSGNNRLVVAQVNSVLGASGTNGTGLGQFASPLNVSVGERGVYMADTGNNRVQSFDPLANGAYNLTPADIRFALSTNFNQPTAVAAVDNLTNELFYVADTGNNRVVLCSIPPDNPLNAWSNIVTQVASGNTSAALTNFSIVSGAQYHQTFLAVGTANTMSAINQIGTLTPVFIENYTAEYIFTNTIDGQVITFPVEFDKENGQWKISSF